MKLFIILASVIVMVIGIMTVGLMNTLLLAASGAGVYYYLKGGQNKTNYAG